MATIAEIMKANQTEIISLMIINRTKCLELIDNLMNLKTLMGKIDKGYNNKLSKVGKIKRITRKVLDETKTEMIEEKEEN